MLARRMPTARSHCAASAMIGPPDDPAGKEMTPPEPETAANSDQSGSRNSTGYGAAIGMAPDVGRPLFVLAIRLLLSTAGTGFMAPSRNPNRQATPNSMRCWRPRPKLEARMAPNKSVIAFRKLTVDMQRQIFNDAVAEVEHPGRCAGANHALGRWCMGRPRTSPTRSARRPARKKPCVVIRAGGATTTTQIAGGKSYDYARAVEYGTEKGVQAQPFFFPSYRLMRKKMRSARCGARSPRPSSDIPRSNPWLTPLPSSSRYRRN